MNPSSPKRKLKITILTVGSVGDVQPYCALGMGWKRAGHQVTVAANENFESFVRQFDLEFAALAPSDAGVANALVAFHDHCYKQLLALIVDI